MKFIVRRTSQHRFYDEEFPESMAPPIPGAVRVDDAGGYWTTEEVATLGDLLDLAKREGELIVKPQGTDDEFDDVPGLSEVEIYDAYRE